MEMFFVAYQYDGKTQVFNLAGDSQADVLERLTAMAEGSFVSREGALEIAEKARKP